MSTNNIGYYNEKGKIISIIIFICSSDVFPEDSEVSRLVKEVNTVIDSIPQLGMTFNLQTEIDLALQPLRSENSQLRR